MFAIRSLAIVLTLALTACATATTPAQQVFAATSTYDAALTAAVAYKRLPSCTTVPKPLLCSDASAVATLQKADKVAHEGLTSAQSVVRSGTATQTSMEIAASWAREAAVAFSRIAAQLQAK